jgi:hypothetical protein
MNFTSTDWAKCDKFRHIAIILNHVWVPRDQKLCIVGLFIKISTCMVSEIIIEYDTTLI